MATILIKNLPDDVLKELKRLKVELGCRTWAELLAKLVQSEATVSLSEEELRDIEAGIQGLLRLRSTVSSRWSGRPTVLEEARRSRRHETG
jgi:predicted CopG family antitoxin